VSSLRARCPDCRTLTAVALGPEYQCHSCGREFPAGLVRVPRAWGTGGEAMADAAALEVPYPETAVIAEASLEEQTRALAAALPERPVALGGCCCAHVGAVEGLAARGGRLGVVWLDAHGDLNTPETSPSGNLWGMPFRMLLDGGAVAADDVALVGARSLDPGELEFMAEAGIDDSLERALAGVDRVYLALDLDVLDPSEISVHVPEPDGLTVTEVEAVIAGIAGRVPIAGVGVTGLVPHEANLGVVTRLLFAAGL
jgi:arginase family enzyme